MGTSGEPAPASEAKRPKRFYPIDRGTAYSLEDAAKALEIPEGKLRRAILMDDLAAEQVDDDRHYLLQGDALQNYVRHLRPAEECVFVENGNLLLELAYCLIIPLLILLLLIFAKTPEMPRSDQTAHPAPPADCSPRDAGLAPPLEKSPADPIGIPNY